jgi:hypothetical protein
LYESTIDFSFFVNFVQNGAGYGALGHLSVNGVGVGGLNNFRKVFADMSLVSLPVSLVEFVYGYEIGAFGGGLLW